MNNTLPYTILEHGLKQLGLNRLPTGKRVQHLNGMEIAHRGQCSQAPENTLAAIELAADVGAKGVEFDVGRTKDDCFVLMHDLTIDRTTTGQGKLLDLTMDVLGHVFIKETEQGIPTLEHALELVARCGLHADIEVKGDVDPLKFANQLERLVKRFDLQEKIWVSSFYPQHLYRIRKQLPWLTTALNLTPKPTRNPILNIILESHWLLDFLGVSIIKPEKTLLIPTLVQAWHEAGYVVMGWTLNTIQEKKNAQALGIAMITDCVGGFCAARTPDKI